MNRKGFTTIELALICLIIGALTAFAINGCGTLYPKPVDPICSKPEAKGSVICDMATYLKTTPEQIDSMLLDASLVSLATKITTAAELRKTFDMVEAWVAGQNLLTMEGISKYLGEKAAFDPYLAMLISRRLPILSSIPNLSIKPLTPYDKNLVLLELKRQREQVAYF
jgi:hypothetical protein